MFNKGLSMDTSGVVMEPWLRALIGEVDVPARRIKPSRYSVTGYVASTKASSSQDAESSLEHDFLTLLEYDWRVERYLAQPFSIEWRDKDRRIHRYTPDVIAKYSYAAMKEDGHLRTTVFEVKPRAILQRDWAELRPKFRAAIGWAREHSCRFHIVTEDEIRTPYLTNVRFLLGYRSRLISDDPLLVGARQDLILKALSKLHRASPKQLLDAITPDKTQQAELIPWLWNLVNQRLVGIDLTKPINMASPMWSLESIR